MSGLAADGHGGAWYFTERARQDTLFHVLDATGKELARNDDLPGTTVPEH